MVLNRYAQRVWKTHEIGGIRMSTLIAFFSRADENYFGGAYRYIKVGNTEVVANQIKELTGADSFKIEMKTPYAADYNTCIDQAKKDKNAGVRPELADELDGIDEYDTIVLMYPNYWGSCPMAVFTFLEKYDFTGKTILPLCTHEGSGMGGSERDIAKAAKGATLKKGLPINGSSAANAKLQVEKWLKDNGVI
jgi:flavodoxin